MLAHQPQNTDISIAKDPSNAFAEYYAMPLFKLLTPTPIKWKMLIHKAFSLCCWVLFSTFDETEREDNRYRPHSSITYVRYLIKLLKSGKNAMQSTNSLVRRARFSNNTVLSLSSFI